MWMVLKECRKNEEDRFFELVSCRKTRIPVQHLTGVQEFMGYEFAVNETCTCAKTGY